MKISTKNPPIYDTIRKSLNVNWDSGICIVYGDTCYSKNPLSPDLLVHEETHVRQQEIWGPEEWWRKWLEDKVFRLEQEVEAYKNQAEWVKANSPRNYRRFRLNQMAKDLSSGLYGNICDYLHAKKYVGLI